MTLNFLWWYMITGYSVAHHGTIFITGYSVAQYNRLKAPG